MPTKSGSSIEATESTAARAVLPMVLVLLGVSGSGNSTVALELHRVLGWPFQEGDDLHPASNVEKMRSGRPLDDADRLPWRRAVAGWIDERLASTSPASPPVPPSSVPIGTSRSAAGRDSASSFLRRRACDPRADLAAPAPLYAAYIAAQPVRDTRGVQ